MSEREDVDNMLDDPAIRVALRHAAACKLPLKMEAAGAVTCLRALRDTLNKRLEDGHAQ